MRKIIWITWEDMYTTEKVYTHLKRCHDAGFNEAFIPYLLKHPNRPRIIQAVQDADLCLIAGVPNIVDEPSISGFKNSDGEDSMPSYRRTWTGIPNFCDGHTLELVRKQVNRFKHTVPGFFTLVGNDYFGYPDTGPFRWSKKGECYWLFDDKMLTGFRYLLSQVYVRVENLNAQLNTHYTSFDEIMPATSPSEDEHGVTYNIYTLLMDTFFYNLLYEITTGCGVNHVDIHMALDRGRTYHHYALGRVGLESRMKDILSRFQDVDIWHWCNSVYAKEVNNEPAIDLARYTERIANHKSVVGIEGWLGLIEKQNGLRAIQDGHGGFVCRLKLGQLSSQSLFSFACHVLLEVDKLFQQQAWRYRV